MTLRSSSTRTPSWTSVLRYPCAGIATFLDAHCPICHGEGKVTEEEKIRVEDRMKAKATAKASVSYFHSELHIGEEVRREPRCARCSSQCVVFPLTVDGYASG